MENKLGKEEAMREAIRLSGDFHNGGGPFGCVIVKDGAIVGRGSNVVTLDNDPTAHAEIVAIRDACKNLGVFQLNGCELYTSCEPCPMCFGAIYWARPDKVYYANTKEDAAAIGFDDEYIYQEIKLPPGERSISFETLLREEAQGAFGGWESSDTKIEY